MPDDRQQRQNDQARRVAVLIADPHPGIRSAIHNALNDAITVNVAGEAPDLPSAINAVCANQIDIVLADSQLAGLGSGAARTGLTELARRVSVIVMGMGDPRAYTLPLQAAGAAGYWPKDGDLAQLTGLLSREAHRHLRIATAGATKRSLKPT